MTKCGGIQGRVQAGLTRQVATNHPCPMCATGITDAGPDAVVYSVSAERATELRGGDTGGIPSDEVSD